MMNEQPAEQNLVFCMEECDREDCSRNRYRAITCQPHSFAYLRNTEYCPLNNLKKQEKTS